MKHTISHALFSCLPRTFALCRLFHAIGSHQGVSIGWVSCNNSGSWGNSGSWANNGSGCKYKSIAGSPQNYHLPGASFLGCVRGHTLPRRLLYGYENSSLSSGGESRKVSASHATAAAGSPVQQQQHSILALLAAISLYDWKSSMHKHSSYGPQLSRRLKQARQQQQQQQQQDNVMITTGRHEQRDGDSNSTTTNKFISSNEASTSSIRRQNGISSSSNNRSSSSSSGNSSNNSSSSSSSNSSRPKDASSSSGGGGAAASKQSHISSSSRISTLSTKQSIQSSSNSRQRTPTRAALVTTSSSSQKDPGSSTSTSTSSDDVITSIKQNSQSWQHLDDQCSSSSYAAYTNARVIAAPPPDTRNIVHAFTPEAAEAVAYSDSSGIHRLVTPQRERSYATVDPEPALNPAGDATTIKPFARSNQDVPGRYRRRDSSNGVGLPYQYNYGKKQHSNQDTDGSSDPRYSSSGAVEQPVLVVGELSYAQTYAGATAVAASDSVPLSKGGKPGTPDGTTIAASNAVTWVPGLIQANVAQQSSVATSTAQRVGSLAASGVADGQITLAQADAAVSMAQTEAMEWDENYEENWHDPVIEFTGDWTSEKADNSIWGRLGFSD